MSSAKSIPAEFHQIGFSQTLLQVFKNFLLWLIPGTISYLLVRWNSVLWVLVPFFALIGGHGLQCVALLGHEGTHFALHKDKWTSAFWGVLLSSFVPFHLDVGFAVNHAEHHAFTNTERDPDHVFFGQFKSFFPRFFLARLAASDRYLKATLMLALDRWPQEKVLRLGLTMPETVKLARLNFLFSFGLVFCYLAASLYFPLFMLSVLWIPFVVAMLISGLRPFVEHVDTQPGRGNDSRSWISPIFDFLYGSINYHQAHHLWPKVPSYKLKKLHHWMEEHQAGGLSPESLEIHSLREFFQVVVKKTS